MYNIDRFTPDYVKGLSEFMKCAEAHRKRVRGTLISCPCVRCRNITSYDNSNTIRHHLIEHGFDTNYTCWNLHGEIPPQVDNDTIVSDFNMDENFGNDDNHRDNLDEMLHDAKSNVDEKNVKKLQQLFNDAEKPLFERCKKFTKLSLVVRLLDLKAKNNWSDRSFTTLLELLHEAFLEDNELPVMTKDSKDLHECPVCKASRYKHHKNLTEFDSDVTKNGPPAKMLWYLPIIPRLKKLYANPKDAKLLRWHAEERKTDGKMRHVADSPQWKNIDRDFKKFGSEIRNIRFGLCSDRINPFKSLSSRHSTWPVLLCIYNLPPWLCMKRKYIMMSLLIQGSRQPGNDIDVYLRSLIDDMIDLWETVVEIYDAYKKERFQLFVMIYCTINDFPAYGNLSGYGTKGEKAYPVCENGTHSRWMTNCRKTIYMGNQMALHRHHPYHKKENLFDGTSEDRSMPKLMDEYATLSQVADLNITFGKKVKAPPKRLLLNILGKTKDGVNARKDMLAMGIRSELAPQETNGKKIYLPPACYTFLKAKKTSFCECLHGIKVPSDYSANIKNLVSMKDLKLLGYVRNLYRPEGSIIQGYAAEEVVQFCTNYMDDVTDIGLPQPRHQDSLRMEIAKDSYYGVIEEIWELDYTTVVIPILKCKWVDNTRSGVKVDNDGFTCVNLSTNGYLSDPFILEKQVDQLFYVKDLLDKRWHIILKSKQSIVGVDDVVDEDEYNKFDELPPFFIGFQSDDVLSDTIYLRSDHQEGQED
nr:hypothetical protein [Tanacetum cinerariifolium]